MTDIDQQLRASDPVRRSDLEHFSSNAAFDELFETIVAGGDGALSAARDENQRTPVSQPTGRRSGAGYRRAISLSVVSVAAVALVVALLATPVWRAPARAHQPTATPGPGSGTAPLWKLVSDLSPSWRTLPDSGFQPGLSLSCPTTTTCYASDRIGSGSLASESVIVTEDGGIAWHQSQLPVALSEATQLACVNADTCALLGLDGSGDATFLETTDAGQTWSVAAGPSELSSPWAVVHLVCATATSCLAVGSVADGASIDATAFMTNDGGNSWTASAMPTDFVALDLQCLSASRCLASGFSQSPDGSSAPPTGTILYTTNGGSNWAPATVPSGLGQLSSLSCGNASECVAGFFGKDASTQVLHSNDGGVTWTVATASGLPGGAVLGLSCPDGSDCWAVGTARTTGRQPEAALSVATAGGFAASTADGGQTFQAAELPQGVGALVDVSCPSPTSCFAVAFPQDHGGSQVTRSFVFLAYES